MRRRDELEATRLSRWGLVGFALLGIFVGGTILGLGELEPRSALAQANSGHFTPGWPDPVRANAIQARTGASNVTVKDSAGNTLGTFRDDGTTGTIIATGDINAGTGHVYSVTSGDAYISPGPQVSASLHLRASSSGGTQQDEWIVADPNTLTAQQASASTIQGASNQDLHLKAQGTTANVVDVATGDGSANAVRLSISSSGLSLPVVGEAINGPAGTLLIQAGGLSQSVSIRPTNGSGVDTTDTLSVQAAGGSWTTSGTTLIDLTAGALNFPAGGKFGGGTAVVGLHHGSITLSAGSGTATVGSAEHCVCTDTTANASVKCAVASTTLTATGTGTDVISFLCVK